MEDIFRRGDEWSEGRELLLLMSRSAGADSSADDFLDRLAQLAEHMGSLPVSRGPVKSLQWRLVRHFPQQRCAKIPACVDLAHHTHCATHAQTRLLRRARVT